MGCGLALQNTLIFHNTVLQNSSHWGDVPVLQTQEQCDLFRVTCMGSSRTILWQTDLLDVCSEGILKALSKHLEISYINKQFLYPYFFLILLKSVRYCINCHSLCFSTFCVHISLSYPADDSALCYTTPTLSQTMKKETEIVVLLAASIYLV